MAWSPRRRYVWAAAVAVLASAGAATGFLVTQDSEEEEFRKSAGRKAFCETAVVLDLSNATELTPHDRRHTVEDLGAAAPQEIAPHFNRLTAWYQHPEPDAEKAARASSYRVGEFIERVCDINIGGIRS
ncbi:hypothetical protein ACFWVT_23895 [Streptomyces cyaneofuscatus]|uniref:hypothetical protein n=1 Tax=Streptomyces cyaneofuscatus TaxID=66883 RepID=UPI00364EFFEE